MMGNLSRQGLLLCMVLVAGASSVQAAEQHAGDIQPWLENGQVMVNGTLFEGDFGDLSGGAYRTDDPGYDADTAKGAFGAGNWLRFEGLDSLKFWNGSSWTSSVPDGEHVEIEDALGNSTGFASSGVTNSSGVIGQFDAAGDLHEHLEMSILNGSNALGGGVGAYWISLRLFETLPDSLSPVSVASDPFHLVLNRGLSEAAFEAAVDSVSAVPLPPAVYLLGSALAWMFGFRRGPVHGA